MKVKTVFVCFIVALFILTAIIFIANNSVFEKKYDNYILAYAESYENKEAVSPLEYYGYRYLLENPNSEALVRAYNKIAEGVQTCEESILLFNVWYPLTPEELDLVYYCYRFDYPQSFWVESTYSYKIVDNRVISIEYDYSLPYEQLEKAKESFNDAVTEVLQNTADLSDIEKEIYIFEYIVNNITYDPNNKTEEADSAYGALINKNAVCEGQSKLFLHLMREAGIPCMVVIGKTGEENHSWNIVEVEGNYFNVDVTWDGYYTRETGTVSYRYFNVTDEEMAETHTTYRFAYNYPNCNYICEN